jgi:hypothetical protein
VKEIDDGQVISIDPKKSYLKLECCDCGLIHSIHFEVQKDGKVSLALWRDNKFKRRKK